MAALAKSPAIVSGERRRTHAAISDRAAHAAASLKARGLGENDTIALMLRNDFPFFEGMLAANLLGAYTVPLNWHATPDEAGYILRDSGASVLVIHADLLEKLGALETSATIFVVPTPPEIASAYGVAPGNGPKAASFEDWETLCLGDARIDERPQSVRGAMIYTSGTTGKPKGVRRRPLEGIELENVNLRSGAGYGLDTPGTKVVLMNGPMYHAAPNNYAQIAFRIGADIILEPRFDAEEMLQMIETYQVTHMHIVPIMMHRLLRLPDDVRRRYDLSSLVDAVHGAAPCPPDVKRSMIAWWGPVISEYYGSSETGLVTRVTSTESLNHPGSVGRALAGVDVRITDDEGKPLGAGLVGDVYVRSVNTRSFTYHGDAEKRAEAERDGYVTVGDVGHLDEGGYLYLSDRRRDMIISGGVNIYPAEIEAALLALPGVCDCAVFGGPDDEFGERVIAHIELSPGVNMTPEDVTTGLKSSLARYKHPRHIVFDASLPREDSGKVFKRKLREPYWGAAGRSI